MNKIGIVTLYDDINIGNKLQNFAVQTFFESLGCQCKTLTHWEMAHHVFNLNDLKNIICKVIHFPKKKYKENTLNQLRKKRFRQFSSNHLKLGEFVKMTKISKKIKEKYDFFVTGSDQVWHNWTKSRCEINYFFLKFADKKQRLSLAPSFGKDFIDEEFVADYKSGLEGLSLLTCREESGADLIRKISSLNAHVLLDPTMLINQSIWNDIAKKPSWYHECNYILVYSLGGTTTVANSITYIANKYGLTVIDIFNTNYPEYYCTTPDEFLYLINNAKLVITDSFHACVFSILHKTNFYVFDRQQTKSMTKMTSRLDSLLKKFHLENRKLTNLHDDQIFNTNFNYTDEILKKERQLATSLFQNHIGSSLA